MLKLSFDNFCCFTILVYLNLSFLTFVYSYISQLIQLPSFQFSEHLTFIVAITLSILPRWLSVLYSRERGRTVGFAFAFPYSFVISFAFVFTPLLEYNPFFSLFPNYEQLVFYLVPTAICFCISEVSLTLIGRKGIISQRRIIETLSAYPTTSKLIIGRDEIYKEACKLLNNAHAKEHVWGVTGTFSFIDKPHHSKSFKKTLAKFRDTLSNACERGVIVRWVGPITKDNYEDAIQREKLCKKSGGGIRHLVMKEGFLRILVSNSKLLVSIPIRELPEECHLSFAFEDDPGVINFARNICIALWSRGMPLSERIEHFKKL